MVHTILIYAKIVNPAGACVALQALISHLLAFVGVGRTPPLVVLARAMPGAGHGSQKFKPSSVLEESCSCGWYFLFEDWK